MKIKQTKFNTVCSIVADNISIWNKEVKDKKYKLNVNDSSLVKEAKIYRYLNEHDEDICRLILKEPNKAEPREI